MKNRLLRRSLIVLVFAIIALTLGGCPGEDNDDMTGGGWLEKENGKKVNFGFNFKCKTDDNGIAKASGQLQYNDRENGVRFHGVANSLGDGECNGLLDKYEGSYYGTYTPKPRGEEGTFIITVVDVGNKGPSKGDELTLELRDGLHDGYKMSATLAGGNIQAHGDKESE